MHSLRRAVRFGIGCLVVCSACSASTNPDANTWRTGAGAPIQMNFTLSTSGTSLGGTGGITVSIPNYGGDSFIITSGTMTSQTIAFTATLGANPDGNGGTYVGSLAFNGTFVDANTISGSVTYTPPRTKTQTFTQQNVTGVTLTKPKD